MFNAQEEGEEEETNSEIGVQRTFDLLCADHAQKMKSSN